MIISCDLLIIQNKGSFPFKDNLASLLKDTVMPTMLQYYYRVTSAVTMGQY